MDPMAPRELHFSHNSTQLRAVLVDDRHLVAFAADNPCSICGDQLNSTAFYATEPDTFYVHAHCALRFCCCSSSSRNRNVSQLANPYVPQTYVNPYHMNSYANNSNFYRPPVPNYLQARPSVPNLGPSVPNYPQSWASVPNYLPYAPPAPSTLQYVPLGPNSVHSAPYSHGYPANSSTGNYAGSAGRTGLLGLLGPTVLGAFLQALFEKMFDEVQF